MLDGTAYILLIHAQQQMYMVRHQTVGIKRAERRQAVALVIVLFQHLLHASEHTHIVLRILEDILPVDAPKHHVVDTRSRFLPRLSRHISLNDFYSLFKNGSKIATPHSQGESPDLHVCIFHLTSDNQTRLLYLQEKNKLRYYIDLLMHSRPVLQDNQMQHSRPPTWTVYYSSG